MVHKRCVTCGAKVEWIVLGINVVLFAIKAVFAFMSGSRSLLADAFESMANTIITVVVLASLRIAKRGYDEKFPYGYGKVEFLAAGIVNLLLLFGAGYLIITGFQEMFSSGPEKPPKLIAILAAVVSIVGNWFAFSYGRCVGKKLGSASIMANAWASYADIATSAAVIIAVVGTNLGITRLDHIVSLVIASIIIKVAASEMRMAVKGLMDTSVKEVQYKVRELVKGINEVENVMDIKTRRIGRGIHVDLDVTVPGKWKVRHGLDVMRHVRYVLLEAIEGVEDVSVRLLPATQRIRS